MHRAPVCVVRQIRTLVKSVCGRKLGRRRRSTTPNNNFIALFFLFAFRRRRVGRERVKAISVQAAMCVVVCGWLHLTCVHCQTNVQCATKTATPVGPSVCACACVVRSFMHAHVSKHIPQWVYRCTNPIRHTGVPCSGCHTLRTTAAAFCHLRVCVHLSQFTVVHNMCTEW